MIHAAEIALRPSCMIVARKPRRGAAVRSASRNTVSAAAKARCTKFTRLSILRCELKRLRKRLFGPFNGVGTDADPLTGYMNASSNDV